MGRASRKGHWTDTHPDRELWSPGRLAVARTQTREEYEALYGRSSFAELSGESQALRGLSQQESERVRFTQGLSDEEILEHLAFADPEVIELEAGSRLYKKSEGLHQGVGVRALPQRGQMIFESFATIDDGTSQTEKTIYKGRDLQRAIDAANGYMDDIYRLGYRRRTGTHNTVSGHVTRERARRAAEEALHGVNLADPYEKG